jgi:hypothetical protein
VGAQIERIVGEFEKARDRLRALVAARPCAGWAVRPAEGSWSAAECVAHLNLTGEAYVPVLEKALSEARALGGPPPRRYRRDGVGWMLSAMVGPLPGVGGFRLGRVRTPPAFEPSGVLDRDAVLAEFDRLQDVQIAFAREADGLPLERVKVRSPFAPNVTYNLWSCLVILPRHQRRHLRQAEAAWSAGRVTPP